MSYYIYQLAFDSPVHFGSAELGGKLEKTTLSYPADTLFSAMCHELASQGWIEQIEVLYQKALQGQIVLSDLYPFREVEGEYFFYVPKPILPIERVAEKNIHTYEEACLDSVRRKKTKKVSYIRASRLEEYIQAMQMGDTFDESNEFGTADLVEKVNCRGDEPMPYYVSAYTFSHQTGLYGIIEADEGDIDWLMRVIESLGYSGIGGKRSSGYGKFHFADDYVELEDDMGVTGVDDGALYARLTGKKYKQYMTIASLLPKPEMTEWVKSGYYTLRKRSGFADDIDGNAIKRNSLYMISSGACFSKRVDGTIAAITGMGHPIYRYGKGMFLGLM